MSNWKYIMLQVGEVKVPVLFPGTLVHKDITEAMYRYPFVEPCQVVSAGSIPALQVLSVEGRSSTLNIDSQVRDADVINTYPYNHGRESTMPGMGQMIGLRFVQLMLEKLG